jgi:flagellar basal body-associated protein FliL
MSTVDKVIYDALVGRQSVVLPGVGSLVVKRRGAKKMPGDRIIPPQNVVSFTEEEIGEGESVVYLLSSAGEIGEADAAAAYAEWLEGARSDKGVAIVDAGEIRDGKFVVAQPLHTALNPATDAEGVVLKKDKKGGMLWLWIVLGLVLAAIALVLLSYFGNGFLGIQKKPEVVEVAAPVIAPVAVEPVVEDIVIAPAPEPAFHVIAGSFAIESNADDYVKKLQKAYPELAVQKIQSSRNGNWLVSIFNAPTERQAYNKMNKYWDIDLDLWVYEQK